MNNQAKPILVPTDFTSVAQSAVEMAAGLAKRLETTVLLVHIVKRDADEIAESTAKVTLDAETYTKQYGVQMHGIVREGSIFSTIGETVTEVDAGLVVIGTHGIKGRQKITGSWVLKVIITSKVPIFVVQDTPKTDIKNIVFPVSFKRETREKIGWACSVAHLYGANVHVIREKHSRDKKIEQSILTNILFTEKTFKAKRINYDMVTAEGKESLDRESLQYAEKLGADLIVITTTKNISKVDYFFGISEEGLLANHAQIPILCINPHKNRVSGFSATGN